MEKTPVPPNWRGDFTGDGWCHGDDIQLILATNLFDQGSYASTLSDADGAPQTSTVVPEPWTLVMLVAALIVSPAGAWGRRRS